MPGKVVGMLWTMLGICLISLFTASVTNIMRELLGDSMEVERTILGVKDVGVLRGSIERHLVLQEGGEPHRMLDMFAKLSKTSKFFAKYFGNLYNFKIC